MKFTVNQRVAYKAHDSTQVEFGRIVRVRASGLCAVMYDGDQTPKTTRPEDLQLESEYLAEQGSDCN